MIMMMMNMDDNDDDNDDDDDGGSDDSDEDDDLYSVYLFIDLYPLYRYYWRHQGWMIHCRKYM
jgi:hypothetical protein